MTKPTIAAERDPTGLPTCGAYRCASWDATHGCGHPRNVQYTHDDDGEVAAPTRRFASYRFDVCVPQARLDHADGQHLARMMARDEVLLSRFEAVVRDLVRDDSDSAWRRARDLLAEVADDPPKEDE